MADKMDVYDRYGHKAGEIRRSTDEQTTANVAGLAIGAILIGSIVAALSFFSFLLTKEQDIRKSRVKAFVLDYLVIMVAVILVGLDWRLGTVAISVVLCWDGILLSRNGSTVGKSAWACGSLPIRAKEWAF